jgi:hypothetical protein
MIGDNDVTRALQAWASGLDDADRVKIREIFTSAEGTDAVEESSSGEDAAAPGTPTA